MLPQWRTLDACRDNLTAGTSWNYWKDLTEVSTETEYQPPQMAEDPSEYPSMYDQLLRMYIGAASVPRPKIPIDFHRGVRQDNFEQEYYMSSPPVCRWEC